MNILVVIPARGGSKGAAAARNDSTGFGRGRRCTDNSIAFGRGPPLQGDFVRRVVRVLLQHAGAVHPCTARTKSPCSDVLRDRGVPRFGEPCQDPASTKPRTFSWRKKRWCGDRGQAMDGLRSPVGARDGGIRRCARSPHCRGSPKAGNHTAVALPCAHLCVVERALNRSGCTPARRRRCGRRARRAGRRIPAVPIR